LRNPTRKQKDVGKGENGTVAVKVLDSGQRVFETGLNFRGGDHI